MYVLTDHVGRSLGLPAYRCRKAARAAARAMSMVCGQAYGVKLVGER